MTQAGERGKEGRESGTGRQGTAEKMAKRRQRE